MTFLPSVLSATSSSSAKNRSVLFVDPFERDRQRASSRRDIDDDNYATFGQSLPSGSTAVLLEGSNDDASSRGAGIGANFSLGSLNTDDIVGKLAASHGLCCLCGTCICLCHVEANACSNENFVRYLYDYDLFSVPRNFQNCGYLVAYLRDEGIFSNCVIVSAETSSLRGPYSRLIGTRSRHSNVERSVFSDIRRSRATGSLSFRSNSNVIESVNDFDVRKLFRNLMLKNSRRDWLDLKYALQMPSIVVFFKAHGTKIYVPNADIVYDFDLRKLQILSDRKSIGRRLAELTAGFRREFFDVDLPNFDKVEEKFRAMLLDRSLLNMELNDLATSSRRVDDDVSVATANSLVDRSEASRHEAKRDRIRENNNNTSDGVVYYDADYAPTENGFHSDLPIAASNSHVEPLAGY